MEFGTTQSIMYCDKCNEYVVVKTNDNNFEISKCDKCTNELIPVLDN